VARRARISQLCDRFAPMPPTIRDPEPDEFPRIGPAGQATGLSPRMLRYLEEQGVITAERGPGPRGHRHYPPLELHLARAAARAMDEGHPTATLRAVRALAEQRVAVAQSSGDPLAWFELLALARAVERARRSGEPEPPPPHPPESPPAPR
jgi:DNA-binding transcriptional MerR regulator